VLIFIELILGIDNIIFISIAVSNVDDKYNNRRIRYLGLGLALIFRLLMLFSLSLVLHLSKPIVSIFSIKDLILFIGGLFLLYKSISEIKSDIGYKKNTIKINKKSNIILQIALVDLVFSLDSLMAALGLTQNIILIAIAFSITIVLMATMSGYFIKYVEMFPELKTLSLAFISIIGIMLILESLHIEIEKSYIYFAFFFSLSVEALNIIRRIRIK
jgi:predicted tellurium resistance membrane protein TerC